MSTDPSQSAESGRADFQAIESQLEHLLNTGELPSLAQVEDYFRAKAFAAPDGKPQSRLDVRSSSTDYVFSSYFRYMRSFAGKQDKIPEFGSVERDEYLDQIWVNEPILAGAVYSMVAKHVALKWQVIGRRNLAIYYSDLFSRAAFMGGYGWTGFSAPSAQDFYTLDRGVFWETPRTGNSLYGKLVDLGHIDALACTLTGNTDYPVHYLSEITGQSIRFKPGEVAHFTSMNSPRERYVGSGLCAVSRALKAAKLLMGLHTYDSEKLSNLPPEGVCAVTGLTMDEFTDALTMWMSARERDNSLTFPQVLWLVGSQPNVTVDLKMVGFSQLPESFNRRDVVAQYVNTLALDFGVDAREFWPISSGALGTAAESEIQHMKARGKGHGEYISITERILNGEMPEGVEFKYDTQDIEEDVEAASVAKLWIEAFLPLLENQVIDQDTYLRLLADKGAIPDYMVHDDRVVADDMGVHDKEWSNDEIICIEWDGGILKQKRLPGIVLSHRVVERKPKETPRLLEAEYLKGGPGSGRKGSRVKVGSKKDGSVHWESADAAVDFLKRAEATLVDEPKRNIRGNPVPDREALRGAAPTQSAVDSEIELWRNHPVLSQFLPDHLKIDGATINLEQ